MQHWPTYWKASPANWADLRDDLTELNDFVESIDEDLEDLEATVDGESRDDPYADENDGFDEEDEDADAHFAPEGGLRVLSSGTQGNEWWQRATGRQHLHGVRQGLLRAPGRGQGRKRAVYLPHCHKPVGFTPLGPDNVPIAKPYQE